jgi:hypothetical protein
MLLVPRMPLDLFSCEAFLWIRLKDIVEHVLAFLRKVLRHLELAAEDLLVKFASRLVLKGQVASHHGEQDYTTGPDIYARAVVGLPVDHLRCCVAR